MKAKRLVLIVLVVFSVALLAGTVSAAERKIGFLSKPNVIEKEFHEGTLSYMGRGGIAFFTTGEPYVEIPVFYDSLISLQMALNAGEVDAISLPEVVAEYVMNVNDNYEILSVVRKRPNSLALGFRKDNPALRNKFNEALLSMKADGMLAVLVDKYIAAAGIDEPEPVKFGQYENADVVKVAVTGDIPPIDFIAADGTPAGFNTAVLAELAKRMKVNIQLVNIESGARAAALASKRADVVFWFQFYNEYEKQYDIPEDVMLSEAYYTWNEDLHIKKK